MTLDNSTADLFAPTRRSNGQLPQTPHLHTVVSISTAMSAVAFFGLLRQHFVTLVIDVRSSHDLRVHSFASPEDIGYIVRLHPGMEYYRCTSFAPTAKMYKRLRQDIGPNKLASSNPHAWENFLKAYGRLLDERKPFTESFSKLLYGAHTGVAIVCACENHEHCHRSYVCQALLKYIAGLELKVLTPAKER